MAGPVIYFAGVSEPFLLEFTSWYWRAAFDEAELRGAVAAMNEPTTAEEFERGFLTLLRSGETVACGIALDYFDRGEMTSRFVGGNPLEPYAEEVFTVARRLLAQPPRPADDIARMEGANHASALAALWRSGLIEEDADRIAEILVRMPVVELRERALDAARVFVDDDEESYPRLAALITRVEACRTHVEAIAALRKDARAEATAALVDATTDAEWRVRQEAAAALAHGMRFYAHRDLLERLERDWSADEQSSAAQEVRDALAPGPHSWSWEGTELPTAELREAHRELRSPTTEATHRQAFRTMLRSESPVAVGIALEHMHHVDGLTRFGMDDTEHHQEALAVARDVLRQPSSPADLSPGTGAGANHAGALGIVAELGEPEDAPAIVAGLKSVFRVVRECGLEAATDCLQRWEVPDETIIAALEDLIFDSSADLVLRTDAVVALFAVETPQVTAVLLRAARCSELPIQVEGANGLSIQSGADDHRDLLREVVRSWPEDAGDRAWIARDALRP
ncbi:hypothetical protein EV646_1011 [Kribbella antiqua]|uniref:HEAT repeat protein n=1 Tax=Kribbella antiqua TaxID=2512217 RepID=A0A4R2J3S1_9ACTN|nr:hypothetical protein [Kribbella antiqua]TCO51019.1 hypothetical protein EV646_1011 [Kribbella antiqua]